MSTAQTVIKAEDFAYLTRFCSVEETRYYLTGVYVDVAAGRLVATDSHRMGIIKPLPEEIHTTADAAPVILANIKPLLQACKASRYAARWLRIFADRVEIVETSATAATAEDIATCELAPVLTFPAASVYIDGTFPDYARIVPKSTAGAAPLFGVNGNYVATFALPDKNRAAVTIAFSDAESPDGSPLIVCNQDPRFLGVLMPMRGGKAPAVADRLANVMGYAPEEPAATAPAEAA